MNKEQIDEAINYYNSGFSYRQIAEELGVGKTSVGKLIKNYKNTNKKPTIQLDFSRPKKVDPLEVLNEAIDRTKHHNVLKDYAQINIDSSKPFCIMKAADLHFGGLDVDYKALKHHVDFLLNTDNVYLQLFGDDINLMITHPHAAARHDGWTPEEQVDWLVSFVDKCLEKNKILSMCWGNHTDEFNERNGGFSVVKMLMKYKVPYFRGVGYIDLKVKGLDKPYGIGFTHKTKCNSYMSQVYGNKRLQQMHTEFFGVNRPMAREFITSHTHYPAIYMEGCLPEDRIWFIKTGTFKTNCAYSQRYFGQGRIGVPTVVYHTDRFEHIAFPTPFEAYRYMTGKDFKS
jgi:predicted DNA-binding protein YlxM (UPF0122 family)